MKIVIVLLVILALILAECPNACSGHGSCGARDSCSCQRNWRGADCSERTCPFGHAFIDTPQGDLNHDGSVFGWSDVPYIDQATTTWELHPSVSGGSFSAALEEGHHYMECSNAGICDREIGDCICFPGFEGDACQRTICPNACSNNGVCRTVAEIAAGSLNKRIVKNIGANRYYEGVQIDINDYNLWDANKNQACVCDPGFTGSDCSQRDCPRGDDPLTTSMIDCGGIACTDEVQTVQIGCTVDDVTTGTFQVVFEDEFSQIWKTLPIKFAEIANTAAGESVLMDALTSLPQSTIPSVVVDVTTSTSKAAIFEVTFTGNPGNLPEMYVEYNDYESFCSIGPTDLMHGETPGRKDFTESTSGNKEAITCSGRGLCDFTSGECNCFRGYAGHSCSEQSALAK
eukprot:TRINITY_DN774206_c0_g1_i1.p1 TRINITY_DN774206_c0_g1~~TRINITY_DN774206_c0_g1_i1.p1  ORF type:complete len:401 (+),score=106.64 TRINITY_DN774206_c0_g1_i1:97-1299(+)